MAANAGDAFKGTVHVILAAGSAIGADVARRLASRGTKLILASRDPRKIQALTDEVEGKSIQTDAKSFDEVDHCLREARDWGGRVDGVLNCAGSILLKPAHLTTAAELQQVLSVNLVSAFAAVRAAFGVMRESGGSIVLMSSAAAQIGLANHEAIAAAKSGVIGLMRSAAATYASHGICVNAVAPGLVETPMTARITSNENALKASISMHPLGRVGRPEDFVEPVCWLLNPASRWVTGQVIGIDGGLAMLKTRATGGAP